MNETPATQPPEHILYTTKHGRVNCDVEKVDSKDGPFYSVKFFRWRRDKDDQWKKEFTFAKGQKGDDVEDLVKAAADAENWMALNTPNQ